MIYLKKVSYFNKNKSFKGKIYKIKNTKIINFRTKQNLLSDSDIINLFMGFVRLIKKSVVFEMEKKYQNKIDYLTRRLNQTLEKNDDVKFNSFEDNK